MTGIEEPAEFASAPRRDDVDPDFERRSHRAKSPKRYAIEMPALDVRDQSTGQNGTPRDIDLSPAALDSHCPKRRAEPKILHPRRIAVGPYFAVIRGYPQPDRYS
jgi:hypothetical protein